MIYKLKELGELKNGANYPKGSYGSGIKIVNVKDLFPSHFVNYDDLKELDNNAIKNPAKYGLSHGDILFTRSSLVQSGTGMCAMIEYPNEETIFCGFIIRFRPNMEKVNPYYLTYLLRSAEYRKMFIQFSAQTTITNINQKSLGEVEVDIPDISYQNKVAEFLYNFDCKINTNMQINRNLLEQAESLYNNYLNNSESISYVELNDLADVKGGKRLPKGKVLIKEKNSHPYIRVRDLNQAIYASLSADYEFVDDETHTEISNYIVSENDVVVSIVGTIGLTAIVDGTLDGANLTENCVKVTNLKNLTPEYLFLFLRSDDGKNQISMGTVGAVQSKLPIKNIRALSIPILSNHELSELGESLRAFFTRISSNINQMKVLTELRDTLLPKLMSGELDISDLEI